MFTILQAHEYHLYLNLMDQIFILRKKVFADQLNWDVTVSDGKEHDYYDDLNPAYLVWCDDSFERLYGVIRLMPTTGPTLLYDVFRNTFPDITNLEAPGIWEGTRMCVDEALLNQDMPMLDPARGFSLMLLALCEVAIEHGIHWMVSNYEPQMKRIYKRAGVDVQELGRADDYGKYPVCCGQFEVSQSVLQTMRDKLNIQDPLYTPERVRNAILSTQSAAA